MWINLWITLPRPSLPYARDSCKMKPTTCTCLRPLMQERIQRVSYGWWVWGSVGSPKKKDSRFCCPFSRLSPSVRQGVPCHLFAPFSDQRAFLCFCILYSGRIFPLLKAGFLAGLHSRQKNPKSKMRPNFMRARVLARSF
jgi:hypothetical protein